MLTVISLRARLVIIPPYRMLDAGTVMWSKQSGDVRDRTDGYAGRVSVPTVAPWSTMDCVGMSLGMNWGQKGYLMPISDNS